MFLLTWIVHGTRSRGAYKGKAPESVATLTGYVRNGREADILAVSAGPWLLAASPSAGLATHHC
jgi:hypothetical protein